MTGRPELLEYAGLGVRYLIDWGWDRAYGGWHEIFSEDGTPNRGISGPRIWPTLRRGWVPIIL